MSGLIFLAIGVVALLMAFVGYRWRRDALDLADSSALGSRERIDARLSSVTLGIQTACLFAVAIICLVVGLLVTTGTIRGAS